MSEIKRITVLQSLDEICCEVPYTATRTCHLLFDLVRTFSAPQVVEVSCGYGKATIYLAAAAKSRHGFVRSVDLERPIWKGRTVQDLLRQADLLDVCEVTFECDARWYLLDVFARHSDLWIDFAYLDAAHTIEVDAFAALALWNHLRPDGLLVFDDLEWIPQLHGPKDKLFSHPSTSHVRVLYDYICRLPSVREKAEWGRAEVGWTWGFVRKDGTASRFDMTLEGLLTQLGTTGNTAR